MGEIVTAFALSHAPRLWTAPEDAEKAGEGEKLRRCNEAIEVQRERLNETDPEVIIAFLNDHFENFFRNDCIPQFCVGIGDNNFGPIDPYLGWLPVDQQKVPNDPEYAQEILSQCLESGINPAYTNELGFGHNLMGPIKDFEPSAPIVPIMTNAHAPPVPAPQQAVNLGRTVRKVIKDRPEDVAIIATGATSHWPPYWYPSVDEAEYWLEDETAEIDINEFMKRVRTWEKEGLDYFDEDPDLLPDLGRVERLMAEGHYGWDEHSPINEEWDREVMKAFEKGDIEYFQNTDSEEIIRRGGDGAPEVLNWVAALGAVGGAPAEILAYEPVYEFVCGMGFLSWHDVLK